MARERRKVRIGVVVRKKMSNTAVVAVHHFSHHPLYGKAMQQRRSYLVHDKDDRCNVGDLVKIEETRPISRLKHWRVVEIVGHREVAEVKPAELDRQEQPPQPAEVATPSGEEPVQETGQSPGERSEA